MEALRQIEDERQLYEALSGLAKAGLVVEAGGQWTATERLAALQQVLQVSLTQLADLTRERTDVEQSLVRLHVALDEGADRPATADLRRTLDEIATCYRARCYAAVLSLGGRALEVLLRQIIEARRGTYESSWAIGRLLQALGELSEPVDSGLKNVANLVNQYRIGAVHARAEPPPSESQAALVIHAIVDLAQRTLATETWRAG